MVGSTKGPPQEKLSGFYRPCGALALKGGYCHVLRRLCAHDRPTSCTGPILVTTVTHWCQINTEIGYLQHMSGDLQEGCQWLMDGVPTGAPLYSLASLYHTMFHVPHVYNPAVGRIVQVPQSVNQY